MPGAVGWTVGQGRTALRGLGPGKWLPLKKQPHEQLQEPLKAVGMSACEPPSPLESPSAIRPCFSAAAIYPAPAREVPSALGLPSTPQPPASPSSSPYTKSIGSDCLFITAQIYIVSVHPRQFCRVDRFLQSYITIPYIHRGLPVFYAHYLLQANMDDIDPQRLSENQGAARQGERCLWASSSYKAPASNLNEIG